MVLDNTIQIDSDSIKEQNKIKKINEIFAINDKNRQFKMSFNDSRVKSNSAYEPENHRRGTSSFIEKKSNVIKKQAYEKVFGPDKSSLFSKT